MGIERYVTYDTDNVLFRKPTAAKRGLYGADYSHTDARGPGPASHMRRTDVSLQASGHHRFRTVLTIVQFALVLALIVEAALATRTLQQLQRVRLGFDPRSLQTLTVTLTPAQYPTVERQRTFFDTALERVRALPGVEVAAVTTSLPPTGFATRGNFHN